MGSGKNIVHSGLEQVRSYPATSHANGMATPWDVLVEKQEVFDVLHARVYF